MVKNERALFIRIRERIKRKLEKNGQFLLINVLILGRIRVILSNEKVEYILEITDTYIDTELHTCINVIWLFRKRHSALQPQPHLLCT